MASIRTQTSFRGVRTSVLATFAMLWPAAAWGARLPISIEVAIERGAAGATTPQWARMLGEIGLSPVRMRSATRSDVPSVETIETAGNTQYRVVGVLASGNVLQLPGGRFSQHDLVGLREYFEGLPLQLQEAGVERGMFDLTEADFKQVFADYSKLVTEPTQGAKPADVFSRLSERLSIPIDINATDRRALNEGKPVAQEWEGFALGTALVGVLRESGLALVPSQPPGEPLTLNIAPLNKFDTWWPVGWKPEKPARTIVPAMYKITTIEIAGYTLDRALKALEKPLGATIVYDHVILARREIDPTAINVELPRTKTSIRRAVDRTLSRARINGEFRVDERGRAFTWVTKRGKDSPRATN